MQRMPLLSSGEDYQTHKTTREMRTKNKFVLTLRGDIYILSLALPGPVAGRV